MLVDKLRRRLRKLACRVGNLRVYSTVREADFLMTSSLFTLTSYFPKIGKAGEIGVKSEKVKSASLCESCRFLAEGKGFEPLWACAQTVFKTASL